MSNAKLGKKRKPFSEETKEKMSKAKLGKTRKNNEEHDTIVRVPVIVEPVRIAVPPVTIPVHIRHAPVAIRVAKRYADYRPYSPPPEILASFTQSLFQRVIVSYLASKCPNNRR